MRHVSMIAITAAFCLAGPALAQQQQTAPSEPQIQPPAQGPGSVEVRPAEPQIQIETAPPEVQVERTGEPQVRVVMVPTIAGNMPEDMVGRTVRFQGGEEAGTVRDFVTNNDGSIESLVLTRGGILGIGERNVPVPWDQVRVNPDNAEMILTMSEEQLEQLPDFEYNQEAQVVIGPERPSK